MSADRPDLVPVTPAGKIPVAVIANANAPYRVATHRYVSAHIPEVHLYSIFTHEGMDQKWQLASHDDFHPVQFGSGESVHVQTSPKAQLREWAKGGRIAAWMRERGVRAVVISGYNDLGRQRLFRWCRSHRLPVFLSSDSNIHGDLATGLKGVVKRALVSRVIRSCTGVLPMGTNGQKYFARYGAESGRMFFFPLIPDLERIRGLEPERISAAASRHGFDPDRRRLVYSGRLAPVKRIDLVIDAFSRIASARPRWDLVVIGDGPLRASAQSRVPAEISGRVAWLGFMGVQDEITAVYRNGHALVLASDYEPWALVVIEAVACGLPVVSSDVVGVAPDIVEDGVSGRFFRSRDLDSLTSAMLDATDPAKHPAMAAATGPVFDRWIARVDPAKGLRGALRYAGVLP